MPDERDLNKGAIWKESDKKSDRHPDVKGQCNLNGVEWWISGWFRDKGANPRSPDVRFAFQRKDDAQPSQAPRQSVNEDPFEEDSTIPF